MYFLLGRMMTPVLDPVSNDLAVVLVFLAPIVSKVFKVFKGVQRCSKVFKCSKVVHVSTSILCFC